MLSKAFYLDIPGEKLLHGEAIAIGMIAEAYLSISKAGLNQAEYEELSDFFNSTICV